MDNVFSIQILAEKLSKLNNSQQSIESLSQWCIFHREKAKQVVETWHKFFKSSQKEQRLSFLYLANDILQNSRRQGSEFVNEFWKVLPPALKDVYENGDEHGKNAVSRLVSIWEERKVFGSRGRSLKDEMLGKNPPPLLESNGKTSNSIRIVKKDAHSIRIKLAVGGMPEKIVTAFQSVQDEHFNEDTALNKCKSAVRRVEKLEKEVDTACTQGNLGSKLEDELHEQENALQKCIEQLQSVEETRATLISQLKEALQDQELKLELIRTQLQVAHAQMDQARSMRQRLNSASVPGPSSSTANLQVEMTCTAEPSPPLGQPTGASQPPITKPVTSFANSIANTEEEHKKAAAAAVAAKLAASTSSALMLSSVLSSLAAEEAASMNGGLNLGGFTTSLPIFPLEKRPKLEKPMPISDSSKAPYVGHVQKPLSSISPTSTHASTTSMPLLAQTNQIQPPFPPPPPPLPPPPPPPSAHQYLQSTSMVGVTPYQYNSNNLPPPPPRPMHMVMGLGRSSIQPQHLQQQQQQQQPPSQPQQQQQQPATGGYYQQTGIGFYGQSHQPAQPPVPRQ